MPRSLPRLVIEHDLLEEGIDLIAGVDEVGRGALAGPVCAGAVLIDANMIRNRRRLAGVNDSKVVAPARRVGLSERIWQQANSVGLGWVEPSMIDRIGIAAAVRVAMIAALAQLRPRPQAVISDAMVLSGTVVPERFLALPRADGRALSVAAASICAKVARDAHMNRIAPLFAEFTFDRNVGYGTLDHVAAIRRLGPSTQHRLTFGPCRQQLNWESGLSESPVGS